MTSKIRRFATLSLLAASMPLTMGMGGPALPMAEGHLAYRLGQYEKAYASFDRARSPEALLWKGNAAHHLGRSEEAIAAWQLAANEAETREQATGAMRDARADLAALQQLLDRYGQLRVAGGDGDASQAGAWRELAGRFDGLARDAAGTLTGRRAAVMAADAIAHAGDKADAIRRFEAAKDLHPQIADWTRWRLAALEPVNAGRHLGELVQRFKESPLRLWAKVELAERESDANRKRAALKAVVAEGGIHPALERAQYLLSRLPGSDRATQLRKYWDAYPEGEYLDTVVRDMAQLPGLRADVKYRIASYFYFNSDYGPATSYFKQVNSTMAKYRLGRAYWGLNQLDMAVSTLRGVVARDRALANRAYLTIGQVEAQRNRWPQAIEAYHKAAALGGEAGVTARWKLSRIYREQGKLSQATSLERSIVANSPWSEEAVSILWQDFWRTYESGRWKEAAVHGAGLAKHHPHHANGLAAQYWMGRLYERLGDHKQALATYRKLIGRSPSTYYGWRALWRETALTGRGQDPWFATRPGRGVEEQPIRWHDLLPPAERKLLAGTAGTALPGEMLAWPDSVRELVFLRQFDVARGVATRSQSPNLKAWMSFLQLRYRQAIREEKGEPRLAYPLGYAPLLLDAAKRNDIDPLLMAALVREESRFDPVIKSWVGATGLAQLMPTTAAWVYKQVPDVIGRPLTDPNANLQLGAWYLAYTHRTFDGSSMHAVAAYNGGPGAVAGWKRRFGGDPDEFVEKIPYSETRLYVKKVFTSYWNYVKLYGGGS